MTKTDNKMTRQEMQDEALVIESLLNTAMSMQREPDREDALMMIEKACERASRLHNALDSVNAPKRELAD